MKKAVLLVVQVFVLCAYRADSQPCTPLGDQLTFGTGNVWIGYFYDNADLTGYRGSRNEGIAASPDFDQNFGGANTTYTTNSCTVQTETFSVRYRLTKTFLNGSYSFTVGGDDGYRLSLDGGVTWAINNWNDHSYTSTEYTVPLNGSYNLVLDYYENTGDNRVSFSVTTSCAGTENTAVYGTGNRWRGYVYDGTAFNTYKGMVQEGIVSNPNFDQNFGGSNVTYATSGCGVQTETFSVRYRLTKTFANGTYLFTVGGDDGYRFSLNGGTTWSINRWGDQSYNTTSYSTNLNGTYNLVLEYYENGGENRISFFSQVQTILAIHLLSFTGKAETDRAILNWQVSDDSNPAHFEIERSKDGLSFVSIGHLTATNGQTPVSPGVYHFTDPTVSSGRWFYRLKMTDTDARTTYSDIVALNFGGPLQEQLTVFPTLLNDKTIFVKSGSSIHNSSISLTDISGKKIFSARLGRIEANQALPVSLPSALQTGIYIIRIEYPGKEAFVQKILVR